MKNLILLFCFSTALFAQDFKVTPLDPDFESDQIPPTQLYQPARTNQKYLRPSERDKILLPLLGREFKSLDDLDRDLLYKSLIHYDDEVLIKKWPFLKNKNLQEIRDAIQ